MTAGFEPGPANPQPFSPPMSLVPSFDVIEVLPDAAADRLGALRPHVHDLHSLTVPFADIHEASNAKLEAERQLKRLLDHPHEDGFNLKADDPRVIVAHQHLAKLVADQRRLNERNETRTAAWRTAGHTLVHVETWLRDGRPHGTVLQDYKARPVFAKRNSRPWPAPAAGRKPQGYVVHSSGRRRMCCPHGRRARPLCRSARSQAAGGLLRREPGAADR